MADQCCKYSMPPESKKIQGKKAVLFILSPFLALLYSLRSLERRSSRLVIFGFCVCFGMAFTVANVRTEGSIDGITYREGFEEYCNDTWEDFFGQFTTLNGIYIGPTDLYCGVVAFLVSRVTHNYHFMFMVFAIVFAFFQLKCLHIFTRNRNYHFSPAVLILALFFLWNSIFNINGVRFWTGFWVAMYAGLQIFYCNKPKYFWLALFTPLFHVSYLLFVVIVLLTLIFRKFNNVWIILYVISFFSSLVIVEIIRDASAFLPYQVMRKLIFYTDESHIQEVSTGTGFFWVSRLFGVLSKIFINVLVIILIKERKSILGTRSESLFSFMMVVVTISNILMPIPSMGGRFITMSYPLIAILWLTVFSDAKYKIMVYLLPLFWLYNLYDMAKLYLSVVDWSFFISSPFIDIPRYLVSFQ